ncbi:MAG: TlpA family protein disulfide reductase [Acidobacteriia bacterium]|nr:TlpA family protein disulfide reductase [Terriglobia bacterium]
MRTLLVTVSCIALAATAFGLELGKLSPAFPIHRLNGQPDLQLSQYRGKVVAFALIDTECPHCQHLTGVLNQVAKEYAGKGVQIVACAFNDGAAGRLPEFIKQFQPSFPIGYNQHDPVVAYLSYSALRPLYVPHMVFLDRRGIVRADILGESDFMKDPESNVRKELDELLKPATTQSSAKKSTTASAAPSHP